METILIYQPRGNVMLNASWNLETQRLRSFSTVVYNDRMPRLRCMAARGLSCLVPNPAPQIGGRNFGPTRRPAFGFHDSAAGIHRSHHLALLMACPPNTLVRAKA